MPSAQLLLKKKASKYRLFDYHKAQVSLTFPCPVYGKKFGLPELPWSFLRTGSFYKTTSRATSSAIRDRPQSSQVYKTGDSLDQSGLATRPRRSRVDSKKPRNLAEGRAKVIITGTIFPTNLESPSADFKAPTAHAGAVLQPEIC